MHYDVIGDIHGHFSKLIKLLKELGYKKKGNSWHCPGRKVLFLGDLIDRGPEQKEVVRTVRAMVEAGDGVCIMGNHEFNAICWNIFNEDTGEYLYKRNKHNKEMHQPFIDSYEDEREYLDTIEWFKTLPLFIETDDFRAIHACWCTEKVESLKKYLNSDNTLKEELWPSVKVKNTELAELIEVLLKGPEIRVPGRFKFVDGGGKSRRDLRVAWWLTESEELSSILVTSKAHKESISGLEMSPSLNRYVYNEDKIVFFGHYWFTGKPKILLGNVICLDYSAGRGGNLVCYRWSGEKVLSELNIKK